MIKLNIQLFASDVVRGDDFTLTAKTNFFANGKGYKSRIAITHENILTSIFTKEDLKNNFSSFVLTKDKVQVMNLLTDNNYIITEGANSKGVIYIDVSDNGIYTITADSKPGDDDYTTITTYSSNSCSVTDITDSRTGSTKTIQKTTEIVTQQTGEPEKVGVIKMFSGSVPPLGWMLCNGAAISRTKYSKLFSVIGITYGSGDGETTFNLPNLKGKTIVGLDETDTDFGVLGKIGGEKTHKLTTQEMPKHFHGQAFHMASSGGGNTTLQGSGSSADWVIGDATEKSGGDQPHNNLQPYIVLNYIIKVIETKNLQAQVVDSLEGDSTSMSPSVRAVKSAISANYDSIPLGTVLDYEGTEIPEGYEQINETSSPKILWKNSNPNTLFKAQTIELSSDDYDVLEIFYIDYQSSNRLMSTKALKNHPGNLQACFQYQDHGYVGAREFTFINSTHIKFVNCVSVIQQDALKRVAVEDWCNPVYIVGYKTGLFS